jgi:chromate transport protein ChrA
MARNESSVLYATPIVGMSELVVYFLRLGYMGFGGPIARVARHRHRANLQGFIKGAYAAAIGTILGACVLLGRIAVSDWLTALIGIAALAILFRWKVSNPLLFAGAACVGLLAFPLLQPAWVIIK